MSSNAVRYVIITGVVLEKTGDTVFKRTSKKFVNAVVEIVWIHDAKNKKVRCPILYVKYYTMIFGKSFYDYVYTTSLKPITYEEYQDTMMPWAKDTDGVVYDNAIWEVIGRKVKKKDDFVLAYDGINKSTIDGEKNLDYIVKPIGTVLDGIGKPKLDVNGNQIYTSPKKGDMFFSPNSNRLVLCSYDMGEAYKHYIYECVGKYEPNKCVCILSDTGGSNIRYVYKFSGKFGNYPTYTYSGYVLTESRGESKGYEITKDDRYAVYYNPTHNIAITDISNSIPDVIDTREEEEKKEIVNTTVKEVVKGVVNAIVKSESVNAKDKIVDVVKKDEPEYFEAIENTEIRVGAIIKYKDINYDKKYYKIAEIYKYGGRTKLVLKNGMYTKYTTVDEKDKFDVVGKEWFNIGAKLNGHEYVFRFVDDSKNEKVLVFIKKKGEGLSCNIISKKFFTFLVESKIIGDVPLMPRTTPVDTSGIDMDKKNDMFEGLIVSNIFPSKEG